MPEMLLVPPSRPHASAARYHPRCADGKPPALAALVDLAADLAFETDAKGRFVFVQPETALGWPAGSLIGQPSELLVGDDGTRRRLQSVPPGRRGSSPPRLAALLRRQAGDDDDFCLAAAGDKAGQIAGARGIGIDLSDSDSQASQIAGRLRRGEVLDHILSRVSQETTADSMMDAALWALIHALGAEGSAIIGAARRRAPSHRCCTNAGPAPRRYWRPHRSLLMQPADVRASRRRRWTLVLAAGCQTRFGINTGLAVWRSADGRPWDRRTCCSLEFGGQHHSHGPGI